MIDIRTTALYDAWFDTLRDRDAKARITVRVRRLQGGNPGQHRVLTGGVVELKIDHGPGYRVYFVQRGNALVLLLVGGDKATQRQDIQTATRLAKAM